MDQMAGALLETASLALLDTSPTGPMAAYGRVIDLGSTFGDGENDLPLVLSQWIETGERPRNAPGASSTLMAPSDSTARRGHAIQWCETLDEHFKELVDAQSQKEADLLRAPRSWEIRVDIEKALNSLVSVIETGVSAVLDPSGNG
jgi:hypothetical protein